MNRFSETLAARSFSLRRARSEILQVNLGKLCNLTCVHCHVNAGPKRKEIMTRETVDRIIDWLANTNIPIVDLTGGAPEMIPDFRHFIERVKELQPSRNVIDRCNLTILLEEGYRDLAEFFADRQVEIIASMPCYSAKNVNAQRGDGVFEGSEPGGIAARPRQAVDQDGADRVDHATEHDRHCACRLLHGGHVEAGIGDDGFRCERDQLRRGFSGSVDTACGPADVDARIVAVGPAQFR